ncbi:DUF3039 domain-containing protein [Agromyces humi]|uniref:DUF3039 domain-containing protein n=1 Tax=Agromyces humi TaxID=1766800 RepID=UPI00135C465B|nr:DUF3039 domain-containing protein [Agromyces humi]
MTEALLEKEEVVVTDDGDHDRFAHFFEKEDIVLANTEGVKIKALCGKWDVPLRDPMKYPICPTCTERHKELKK